MLFKLKYLCLYLNISIRVCFAVSFSFIHFFSGLPQCLLLFSEQISYLMSPCFLPFKDFASTGFQNTLESLINISHQILPALTKKLSSKQEDTGFHSNTTKSILNKWKKTKDYFWVFLFLFF